MPSFNFAKGADGTLMTPFIDPIPLARGYFGVSVTAVGSDQVLVGAWGDVVGEDIPGGVYDIPGSAYLYALPYPQLGLTRNGSKVSVSWVTAETGLVLQQAGALGTEAAWINSTDAVYVTGPTNVVQQTYGSTNRFFRLHRP